MVDRAIRTVINQERSIRCGKYVRVSPSEPLRDERQKPNMTAPARLPAGTRLPCARWKRSGWRLLDPHSFRFSHLCLPDGLDALRRLRRGELVRLMASSTPAATSRQSRCRRRMEDLVKIGTTAPSGTNSQGSTFTTLPAARRMMKLGDAVGAFFKRLNRMAEDPLLRHGLRLIGRPELAVPYQQYHRSVAEASADSEERGRDRLFHQAPTAILVGCKPGASTPAEDALLATQNILLGGPRHGAWHLPDRVCRQRHAE